MTIEDFFQKSAPEFEGHVVDKEAFKTKLFNAMVSEQTVRRNSIAVKRALVGVGTAFSLCVLALGSGIVSPAMAQVLNNVPGVQVFYTWLLDDIGVQNAIKVGYGVPVNRSVTRQGITLTLRSVVVDQLRISLTLGANVSSGGMGPANLSVNGRSINGGEEGGFSYPPGKTLSVVNFVPDRPLPVHFDLGINVTRIGHVRDRWSFVVPVDLAKAVNATKTYYPETTRSFGASSVTVKKITMDPASMVVNYVFNTPDGQQLDSMGIGQTVEDDHGQPIHISGWKVIQSHKIGDRMLKEYQATYFGAPALSSKFIVMVPYEDVREQPKNISADLHGTLPITLNMGDLGTIKIDHVEFDVNETRVYYTYKGKFSFPLSLISVNNTPTTGVLALGKDRFVASFPVNSTRQETVSASIMSASDPFVQTLMKVPLG